METLIQPDFDMNEASDSNTIPEQTEANHLKVDDEKSSNDVIKDASVQEPPETNFSFKLTSRAKVEFETSRENFLKGCKWAPDGTCILTSSNDAVLRIFDLNSHMMNPEDEVKEIMPSLKIQEPEIIYDFAWYPFMNSSNPDTACLFSTAKDNPVHLIDAYTGQVRCSYKGYNHVDELVNAYSIAFNSDASRIYCGYKRNVKIFDISVPGRNFTEGVQFKSQIKADHYRISGIVSCIAFSNQQSGVYAVGSYSKQIGIYVENTNKPICLMESHNGGVTHLMFSSNGFKLFSGGRKDADIFCWDVRNPGKLLQVFKREVMTNQRIYFDLFPGEQGDCKYLSSGNSNGSVSLWRADEFDLSAESEPLLSSFIAHEDCANGVSFHPFNSLFATVSGQRWIFPNPKKLTDSGDESSDGEIDNIRFENSLKIWMHNLK